MLKNWPNILKKCSTLTLINLPDKFKGKFIYNIAFTVSIELFSKNIANDLAHCGKRVS
jgi:hypothetical protein